MGTTVDSLPIHVGSEASQQLPLLSTGLTTSMESLFQSFTTVVATGRTGPACRSFAAKLVNFSL